jgi:hypothetical protein
MAVLKISSFANVLRNSGWSCSKFQVLCGFQRLDALYLRLKYHILAFSAAKLDILSITGP